MSNQKAIIVFGPPGSGKGTQADLISKKYGLYHFDSGKFLRSLFYSSKPITDPEVLAEKKINESGGINSGKFFLKVSSEKIRSIAQDGEGIVFSGSPRTMYETMGDDEHKGFLDNLAELYGKDNVLTFVLEISDEVSVERNSKRTSCSVCGGLIIGILDLNLKQCPFCGGELKTRIDDNPEIIKNRLEEYKKQTYPILAEIEKRGFTIHKIDGTQMPYKVFESICSKLN